MPTWELRARLRVARPRPEVFAFFADAGNLEALTPPWLSFRILTPQPIAMRPGALIEYRLSLHGLPVRWKTEITAWEPPVCFVDQQRSGPYRLWVHEHTFEETADGGTIVNDRVRYQVPSAASPTGSSWPATSGRSSPTGPRPCCGTSAGGRRTRSRW